MLKIELYPKARKFISRVPVKHAKQIIKKIHQLSIEPQPQDSKLLKGYTCLRADSGEYRIIYEIENNILHVLLIGKRNDDEVYKSLKRQ